MPSAVDAGGFVNGLPSTQVVNSWATFARCPAGRPVAS